MDIDWQDMLCYQQQLAQLSRTMLTHTQKKFLTASERELLGLVFLNPENCTPLLLSKLSGMKKEAVSRSLKQLHEKGCIEKEKVITDERSYTISLTEKGKQELKRDYEIMLKIFYELAKDMDKDFITLFDLVIKANNIISNKEV